MTEQIIAFHVAIVIAFVSFGFYGGKCLGFLERGREYEFNQNYKYNVYSWIAFLVYVLVILLYMTWHCFDCITYYNECIYVQS